MENTSLDVILLHKTLFCFVGRFCSNPSIEVANFHIQIKYLLKKLIAVWLSGSNPFCKIRRRGEEVREWKESDRKIPFRIEFSCHRKL